MAVVQANLADADPGRYRCEQISAEGQNSVRLKRLGICQGREIELVGHGDPMVLRIGATQIGLSRQLAAFVTIQPLPSATALPE